MAATQLETCSADALLREFFAQDDLSRLAEGAGALLGCPLLVLDDTFHVAARHLPLGFSDAVFQASVRSGEITYDGNLISKMEAHKIVRLGLAQVPEGRRVFSGLTVQQNLTFDEAAAAFKRYKVDFSEDKYIALGLRNIHDDQYTNLALLLSDQCQHTTKIAVFNDESCTEFRDSKEFGGSIFKQFENSINYLALCNRTVSTIKGVVRTDKQDYPEEAIREALLNALVHRDYSFSGSIIINVNDSKMEFISLGGLLPGLSTEDIRLGVSQPRNKKLAEIFHRLRLIESYGTGIRRIFKLYASCPVQPSIKATTNAFRIVLPNMNAASAGAENAAEAKSVAPVITPQMKIVLDYLKKYGEMHDEELQELLHIKKTRAYLLTRQMSEEGLIEVVGRGAEKKYRLK